MSEGHESSVERSRQTIVVRSRNARSLGAAMMAVGVLGVLSVLVAGLESAAQLAAPLALFGLLGWGAFWQPHVEVSDGGVLVANTLRSVQIPWPAVESVDGRYGLRLRTAYGTVDAWAAGAPSGRRRLANPESEAARAVTLRLESLRAAGYLEAPRLERPAPVVRWHVGLIAAIGVLAVASVALPLLT